MDEKLCGFDGCDKKRRARGLCSGHHQQMAKGVQLAPLRYSNRYGAISSTREEFFWLRVEKTSGCWGWRGTKTTLGYGQLKFQGAVTYAHRYSYELTHGPIPAGAVIDHLCHNPECVNPEHLRLANHTQNMQNLRGPQKNNSSGFRGVQWSAHDKCWIVVVRANGQRYRKSGFSTPEAAGKAAAELRAKLHH